MDESREVARDAMCQPPEPRNPVNQALLGAAMKVMTQDTMLAPTTGRTGFRHKGREQLSDLFTPGSCKTCLHDSETRSAEYTLRAYYLPMGFTECKSSVEVLECTSHCLMAY